jgi:hypothetical protein
MTTKLRKWFNDNYGHLGYSLSEVYVTEYDLVTRFDILKFGMKTKMNNLSLEKIMDFIVTDINLMKLVFDALFRHHGYGTDEDFKPIKQVKEFKL